MDSERILYVNGMRVYAPVCPKCGSNQHTIVKDYEDSWTYRCTKCARDITYDDLLEQE